MFKSLRNGEALDDEAAQMLYSTMRRVAVTHNYPAPDGFSYWDDDAVATGVHDFLTGPRATERLVQLAMLARDDDSFEKLLSKSLRNFLRDEARRTVVGKIVRRLKDVVADSKEFIVDAELVRLAEASDAPFGGDEAALVRAALKVDVSNRRWRPDAQRQGPLANREDTLAMIRNVLSAADSAVSFAALARVMARRYDLDQLPVAEVVDVLDPRVGSEYDVIDVGDQVAAVLDQLTEVERHVLPLLDMSCRDAARLLPYGHSTIAKAQASLRTLLQQILPSGESGAAVLREVAERLAGEH